ncbi:hypothetical protein [Streptomyces sp. NPDC003299]
MPEQPPTLPEAFTELHTAMRRFAAAYVAATAPSIRAFAELVARVEAADRARVRAAWQSPHGPQSRQH